ncbi:MAG: hypothetical protein MUP19_00015 [Candidatus Aminicenantes bacterium]|nr:hypothetical protein [Candidatus Aminicenantes bacterium]
MKSFKSRLLRAYCLVFALILLCSLGTHAGFSAPQQVTKYPWIITGHFIYVEYYKNDGEDGFLEDENQLTVDIDLAQIQHDPYDQIAIYVLDRADFSAKGKAWSHSKSGDCFYQVFWTRNGGGRIDPPSPNAWGPTPNPATLTWFIKQKRFALHFQAPIDKGQVTIKSTDTCNEPTEPVTSDYLWACNIDGVVDYNAKTKTYRFVLFDKYEVPYRENTDLNCTVHVQGEMTGPMK